MKIGTCLNHQNRSFTWSTWNSTTSTIFFHILVRRLLQNCRLFVKLSKELFGAKPILILIVPDKTSSEKERWVSKLTSSMTSML